MKGIKGSLIRGTQKIKQKMGKTDKTVDDEYEMVHNKTLSTEKQAQNFSKHVNQLIENYHAMSTTLSFLAEDMRDLYQSSDPNCKQRQMADQLTKIAERIEQNCVLKFQTQVKSNVVEPSDEYVVQFPPLKDLHNKRENAALEYDYYKDKVQKMSEKQNKDPLALPKAKEKMNQTRDDYDLLNNTAKQGMTDVLDRKDSVYNPAFDQLFANIIQFYEKVAQETSSIKSLAGEARSASSSSGVSSSSSSSMSMTTTTTTTKVLYPSSTSPASSSASSSGTPPRIPAELDVEYFYLDAELERHGPFNFTALKQKFSVGQINSETYVFGGQMPDWTQISALPQLQNALMQ